MLQQLGCGGKSIYIAQHDFGLPQDLRDPGHMVALVKLDRGVECLCHEEKKGYFCHLMKAY